MNAIYLTDPDEVIRKKVMKAVTDSGPTEPNQEKPEIIANLFQLLRILSTPEAYTFFDEQYNQCQIRYGDLKKQLAEDAIRFVAPLRERINALLADEDLLKKTLRHGAEKARESAAKTLTEVRHIIGF